MKSAGRDAQILEFRGFLSFLILHELKQKPQSGDELAVRIGKRKGSTLTPGTIYPTLKRMHKLKLIIYRRDGRKKVYTLTDLGSDELVKQYALFSRYFLGFKGIIRRQPKEKPKRKAKTAEKPAKKAETVSSEESKPLKMKAVVQEEKQPEAPKKEKQPKQQPAQTPSESQPVPKDTLEDISKQ